jgi:hypothetical protein
VRTFVAGSVVLLGVIAGAIVWFVSAHDQTGCRAASGARRTSISLSVLSENQTARSQLHVGDVLVITATFGGPSTRAVSTDPRVACVSSSHEGLHYVRTTVVVAKSAGEARVFATNPPSPAANFGATVVIDVTA